MTKEIEQLDTNSAKVIYKWLLPDSEKPYQNENMHLIEDTRLKTIVRNWLRQNKLTPAAAIESVRKMRAGMPGCKF